MVKKPFSIRIEESDSTRFRALATVLDISSDQLLIRMINEQEKLLTTGHKQAFEALLKVWREN